MVVGEDVVLTKDVLKRKEEFVSTRSESAAENRLQIVREGAITGGATSVILFTVPKNETLFITSVHIGTIVTGGTGGSCGDVGITTTQHGVAGLISLRICTSFATASNDSLNFTSPIKVEAGETVNLTSVGAVTTASIGGFTGWRELKRVSP